MVYGGKVAGFGNVYENLAEKTGNSNLEFVYMLWLDTKSGGKKQETVTLNLYTGCGEYKTWQERQMTVIALYLEIYTKAWRKKWITGNHM